MPIRDPQNDFSEIPWIGLFLAFLYSLVGDPDFSQNIPAFPWRGLLGPSPQIAFSGEEEVDMLGSGAKYLRSCWLLASVQRLKEAERPEDVLLAVLILT